MDRTEREQSEEALAYQRLTRSSAMKLARATRQAGRDLEQDIFDIVATFAAKGGFDSVDEARAFLDGYIEPADRAILIRAAERLPEPDRTRELTRLSAPAYNWRITRKELIDRVQKMTARRLLNEATGAVEPAASSAVVDAVQRAEWGAQREVGAAWSFDLPSERMMRQVLDGAGVYDKVRLFSAQQMEGVKQTCVRGILAGAPLRTISAQVAEQTGRATWQAKRLVRTTTAQAATDAKVQTYEGLGIERYEIVCVLDERTCPICRQYDRKRYRVGTGPKPTFHPNCRCTMVQVIPEGLRRDLTRSARDADGRSIKVPYDMTFAEWSRKYGSESKQEREGLPSLDRR